MSNEVKSPVRYVSRGSLGFSVYVSHRDNKQVVYFFGEDPDHKYSKAPAEFDRSYVQPKPTGR